MVKNIIVIPCYNEESRLQAYKFEEFAKKSPEFELLFVNDGSTDGTQKILESLCNSRNIKLFNLRANVGKAEAIRLAINNLLDSDIVFEYVGYLDADLSTPLSQAERLFEIAKRDEKLMVFGSRVKLLSNKITRNPLRHYLGRVFATFASITLKLAVYDTQCGAKVFHRSVINDLFSQPFSSRWIFDVEIFMRYRNSHSIDRAKEVVLEEWTGYDGSKIKLKDLIRIPFELIKIARNDRKN